MAKAAPAQKRSPVKRVAKSPATASSRAPDTPKTTFPIVGIGASAGGLEALDQFLSHVPPASGLAFVVVQHLDPNHKGILVELLQRATRMPVAQISDRMRVESDHVYVIPPNRDLSILHGVLHLLEPAAAHGLRLPIDSFFRALADDRQDKCVGVILSGMGSDGTLGLRAIKEKAGAVFVQDPASAQFDSMPNSAIDAGLADVVARAEELPGRIVAYLHHVPLLIARSAPDLDDPNQSGLEKVVLILRAQTGHDFSLYKKSTLYRRIERRMGLHQLAKIADYARYLRENPHEAALLFKELLIGVTSFFRDPVAWEQLKAEAIPALLAAHPEGGVLRAWTTACSTGEEAYTLAMAFREVLDKLKPSANHSLQIFATDLDKDAINTARISAYPDNIVADVSAERLRRFFVQDKRGYRVAQHIRDMVIFAPQNVVMDPPFTKLDLLSCRNLLIYLEADLQKKLMPLFHYALNPGGILMLGNSETVGAATDLFVPLSAKTRLYRRLDITQQTGLVEFPTALTRNHGGPAAAAAPALDAALPIADNLQGLTDALLLQLFSPAAVLTTDEGDIVYVSGKTGKYLETATGKANLNVFAMAREGLAGALTTGFAQAVRDNTTIILKDVTVGTNGGSQAVEVTLQPLSEPAALRGMVLIVFANIATPPVVEASVGANGRGESARMAALAQALQQSHEELRTTREEMQSSREELKSTNEELQSTNEELQSTNEELTTSKEEMQSMNEEMQTVNHELIAKVTELERASDDMNNLLNSTNIATLFLDAQLQVRRFTKPTVSIFKLLPGDVGRPITDLVTELDYPQLAEDAREVLRSLVVKHLPVIARDGRWFDVRIMPYRTQSNHIDGVVITFVDTSAATRAEQERRRSEDSYLAFVEAMPIGVVYQNADAKIISGNPAAERILGLSLDQMRGRTSMDVRWHAVHADGSDFPGDAHPAVVALRTGKSVQNVTMGVFQPQVGKIVWVQVNAIPLFNASETRPYQVVATFEDITERKLAEEIQARLAVIVESSDDAIISKDLNGIIRTWNHGAEELFGYAAAEIIGQSVTRLFPPEKLAEELEILAQIKAGETVGQFETVRMAKDGRQIAVSATISPIHGSTGQIIGASKIVRDISATKALEATLREALSVLQGRFTDQTAQLETANALETVLNKAQSILEQRFTAQTAVLKQSQADLQAEKGTG